MADYNSEHHYRVQGGTGEWTCPLLVMPELFILYILDPSVDAHYSIVYISSKKLIVAYNYYYTVTFAINTKY